MGFLNKLFKGSQDQQAVSKKTDAVAPVAVSAIPSSVDPQSLKLINVDEQTAAIIMAIVCDELATPVNELYFKSIRLMGNQTPAHNKGV